MLNQKFFAVFLTICQVLAIFPLSKNCTYNKYYKIYALLIASMITWNYYRYTIQVLYNETRNIQDPLFNFINYLAYFFESLAVVALIMMNIFYKPKTLRDLVEKLKSIDKVIGRREVVADFWLTFISLHVLVIFVIIYKPILCLRYLLSDVCTSYVGRIVLWYYKTITAVLVYALAREIKLKFQSINNLLIENGSKLSGNFEGLESTTELLGRRRIVYKDLSHIKKLYDQLCDVVDDYNAVFGVTLLSGVFVTISNILLWTVVTIYVDILEYKAFSILWISKTLVHILLIADASHGISSEASNITTTCYTILKEVPTIPENYHHKVLKGEALLIAKQSACRAPGITAAGFFEVDYGMIGFILSSVTSYIIVSIQFKS